MNNSRTATVLAPNIVASAPLIYTRAEVANMLGVSVDTVTKVDP
jgi:predicted nucleotidyltransferase